MTYQKLSSPFTAIAVAVLLIAGIGPARAQGISGLFGFTGSGSCIQVTPPATFDSSFRPTAGPVFVSNFHFMGYRQFNANGTGASVTLLGAGNSEPVPPGTFTAANSSASTWTNQFQFTYTVDPSSKIITTTLTPGTYQQTFQSGPRAGQTVTQDVLGGYAYLSANGNNLLTVSKGAEVETRTFSNADVRLEVCNRSSNGFRLP
jgi:hypothetical protein